MQNAIKQEEKTSINSLTYIVGNIKAEEHLVINGKVKGNVEIRDHNFILSPSGRIKGNIHGQNVRTRDHMKGEIKTKGKVEITREAKFSGKIISRSISIEKGAYFDAFVKLGQGSPRTGTLKKNVN